MSLKKDLTPMVSRVVDSGNQTQYAKDNWLFQDWKQLIDTLFQLRYTGAVEKKTKFNVDNKQNYFQISVYEATGSGRITEEIVPSPPLKRKK